MSSRKSVPAVGTGLVVGEPTFDAALTEHVTTVAVETDHAPPNFDVIKTHSASI